LDFVRFGFRWRGSNRRWEGPIVRVEIRCTVYALAVFTSNTRYREPSDSRGSSGHCNRRLKYALAKSRSPFVRWNAVWDIRFRNFCGYFRTCKMRKRCLDVALCSQTGPTGQDRFVRRMIFTRIVSSGTVRADFVRGRTGKPCGGRVSDHSILVECGRVLSGSTLVVFIKQV